MCRAWTGVTMVLPELLPGIGLIDDIVAAAAILGSRSLVTPLFHATQQDFEISRQDARSHIRPVRPRPQSA